jgi:hypothetical protein
MCPIPYADMDLAAPLPGLNYKWAKKFSDFVSQAKESVRIISQTLHPYLYGYPDVLNALRDKKEVKISVVAGPGILMWREGEQLQLATNSFLDFWRELQFSLYSRPENGLPLEALIIDGKLGWVGTSLSPYDWTFPFRMEILSEQDEKLRYTLDQFTGFEKNSTLVKDPAKDFALLFAETMEQMGNMYYSMGILEMKEWQRGQ